MNPFAKVLLIFALLLPAAAFFVGGAYLSTLHGGAGDYWGWLWFFGFLSLSAPGAVVKEWH
jgi:hypothetical protein